jgi:phosphoserine phosphatase
MRSRKTRIAIAYDFDGTLAPGTMQEQSFLPVVHLDKEQFWNRTKQHAEDNDMDEILAYMQLMLAESERAQTLSTLKVFKGYGKTIKFFPGVESWFRRINAHAKKNGCAVAHFIISSGNEETIQGTKIAKEFTHIWASRFQYDRHGVAKWPALAVNYTGKAQYLFRINKGVFNSWDNDSVNAYLEEKDRPYPFKNFLYLGDGITDVPAMKMVTYQGGRSIVVYESRKRGAKKKAHMLVKQHRADIALPADYSEGSPLEKAVNAAIEQIAARHKFEHLDTSPLKGERPPK